MPVKPGYRGKFEIHIDYASGDPTYVELSVKRMQIRESVAQHDSSGTASSKTATKNILQPSHIPGKATCRVNVGAQWGADGAGDPPDFTGEKLYGTQYVRAQSGSQVVGTFNVEEFANTLDVDGTIDYDLSLVSNGTYTRTNP